MRFGAKAICAPTRPAFAFPQGVWTQVFAVPTSGAFTQGMALNPLDRDEVMLGVVHTDSADAACGVWRVRPTGAQKLTGSGTAFVAPGVPIKMIYPDPANGARIIVASGVHGSFGLYRSTDAGGTWASCGNFASVASITDAYNVDALPGDPSKLLVGFHNIAGGETAPSILYSSDGGDTWTKFLAPPAAATTGGVNVIFLGSASRWLYCSQDDGIYLTTNSGSSWSQVTTDSMDHGGIQLVAHGSDWYISGTPQVMRSTDDGASWSRVGPNDSPYWLALASDGTNIYTQRRDNGNVRRATLPATAPGSFSNFGAYAFPDSGSFELHYDAVKNRLWNASLANGLYVYQF